MTTRKKPEPTSARKVATTGSSKKPSAAGSKAKPATAPAAKPTKSAAKPVAPAKAPTKASAPAPAAAVEPETLVAPEPVVETPVAVESAAEPAADKTDKPVEISPAAAAILADPAAPALVGQQAEMLTDLRANVASQAANVLAQIFATRPELLVPHVAKLARAIVTKNKRVVQVCAEAMPAIAKVAPARVARELDFLRASFGTSLEEGQDGLVRTFATLCVASVAYQKRLEPVLTEALSIAEGKMLLKWTQVILPSLKGEPHARARAVVEGRLESLPRPVAQPIADFLGIKLRPRPR